MDEPGWKGAIFRFWQRSYAADYLGYAILQTAYILIQFLIEPFHRMFSLDDLSKSYPHAEVERVSAKQNVLYAGIAPLIFLIIWAAVVRPGIHKVHVTILGLFISVSLASFLTDVLKNTVGRPRPDLIARCKPKPGTPAHILVTIDVCTETDHHTLQDGWRSFPSGHSSFSFSGLGYLSLFLAGQLHIFRPRTDLARVLIAFTPMLGAALIALSRIEDYRHDVYDVTVGSLLGLLVAYFSYQRYYRNLKHPRCDEPYPSRADVAQKNGMGHRRDEEQATIGAEEFELADTDDEEIESQPLNRLRAE